MFSYQVLTWPPVHWLVPLSVLISIRIQMAGGVSIIHFFLFPYVTAFQWFDSFALLCPVNPTVGFPKCNPYGLLGGHRFCCHSYNVWSWYDQSSPSPILSAVFKKSEIYKNVKIIIVKQTYFTMQTAHCIVFIVHTLNFKNHTKHFIESHACSSLWLTFRVGSEIVWWLNSDFSAADFLYLNN